jgi:hypothetical protein
MFVVCWLGQKNGQAARCRGMTHLEECWFVFVLAFPMARMIEPFKGSIQTGD